MDEHGILPHVFGIHIFLGQCGKDKLSHILALPGSEHHFIRLEDEGVRMLGQYLIEIPVELGLEHRRTQQPAV